MFVCLSLYPYLAEADAALARAQDFSMGRGDEARTNDAAALAMPSSVMMRLQQAQRLQKKTTPPPNPPEGRRSVALGHYENMGPTATNKPQLPPIKVCMYVSV